MTDTKYIRDPLAPPEPACSPILIDVATGPTPEQTDQIILEFEAATRIKYAANETEKDAKQVLITLVRQFGHPAAGSEHSFLIEGALNTALVTDTTSTSVNEEFVLQLKNLLNTHGKLELFPRLFVPRIKHDQVAGADEVLRVADLPKWLRKEAQALYGQCIKVTKQAPRVKVDMRLKEPKQRKPRAKKAVQG